MEAPEIADSRAIDPASAPSGDSRRSHSPATNEIREDKIESCNATAGASRPISQTAESINQIQLHKETDTSTDPSTRLDSVP
jgi:hypothetical protein